MKRVLKFNVLFVVVAALMLANGLFAQTHNGSAVPAATNFVSGATQTSIYVTEGTTVPIYALPDPYFHPSYVAGTNHTLTNGFNWVWTVPAGLTYSQSALDDNYITLTAGATASTGSPYSISVVERAPAALGGCTGTATNLTVNVVAAPSATLAGAGGTAPYAYCEGNAGLPTGINVTIAGGWQNYRLVWSLEIATLDASNAKEFYYNDQTGAGRAAAQKYAVNYTTAAPEAFAASGSHSIMTVPSFDVINNGTRDAVTVYTYTLTSLNDNASRFGDYIALNGDATNASAFTYYPAAATVTVTVYPAPVTGPIFHISNTWAN